MTGKCLLAATASAVQQARPALSDWYPNRLKGGAAAERPKRQSAGRSFNYAEAFNAIDLERGNGRLKRFVTTSVAWWPSVLITAWMIRMLALSQHHRIAGGMRPAGALSGCLPR
jgi:catalase (peroxidase I)